MLATADWMMVITGREPVTWIEIFTLRAPFAIYAGWLTAATILNSSYAFMILGMKDDAPDDALLKPLMFMSEETYTTIILWIAFVIYEIASWSERNPLFGSIFIWVIAAVLGKSYRFDRNPNVQASALIILILHTLSMAAMWGYSIFEEF